jgi:hypothetical protein
MNTKHFIFVVTSEGQIASKRMVLMCIWCGDDAEWNQLAKGSIRVMKRAKKLIVS